MLFRYYLDLLEALRKVKSGTIPNVNDASKYVGTFQGRNIVKTDHIYDIRKGEKKSRGYGISNNEFIEILKKSSEELGGKKLNNGPYSIVYKNIYDKYDKAVVNIENNSIIIITIIQGNKKTPTYSSKDSDIKIITEKATNREMITVFID